jgi:hypothetical protein
MDQVAAKVPEHFANDQLPGFGRILAEMDLKFDSYCHKA